MEGSKDLSRIVKKIQKEALDIVLELKPYLFSTSDEDGEPYEKVKETLLNIHTDLAEEDIDYIIKEVLLELVSDSEAVIKEMPSFLDHILNGQSVDDFNDCFVKQLWLGDIYDEGGLKALTYLLDDLKKQRERCNQETIIGMCEERLMFTDE